jgi:hypothetical protein
MALPVSLGTMLTEVQRRANVENFVAAANTFITLPEIRSYLNETLLELYDMLIAARSQEWFRKSFQFNTIGNQPAYPCPPDMYQLLSVDIFFGGNLVVSAKSYHERNRNALRWVPGWSYWYPVYYRLIGSPSPTGAALTPTMINFIPFPSSAIPVTLNYYPTFTPFATDGTEDANIFNGISGWEGYAIWKTAAICLEKMQKDSTFCRTQVSEFKQRIEALAADQNAGESEQVADTYDQNTWIGDRNI